VRSRVRLEGNLPVPATAMAVGYVNRPFHETVFCLEYHLIVFLLFYLHFLPYLIKRSYVTYSYDFISPLISDFWKRKVDVMVAAKAIASTEVGDTGVMDVEGSPRTPNRPRRKNKSMYLSPSSSFGSNYSSSEGSPSSSLVKQWSKTPPTSPSKLRSEYQVRSCIIEQVDIEGY